MIRPQDHRSILAEQKLPDSPHRIVIVGGGAGGLELAARLGKDLGRRGTAEIVLVDPQPVHVWKPLLHEMAAGTLSPDERGLDFLQQARRHHFRFYLGALTGLDRGQKRIKLAPLRDDAGEEIAPARTLWYDTLVIAVGGQDNDFGIRGVAEHTIPLNRPHDARQFHRKLLNRIARTEILDLGPVRITIVGGGATGVELAAELADASREIATYGTRLGSYPDAVKLHVIESGPRLLSSLPEFISEKAEQDLTAKGVVVLIARNVTEVRADAVVVSNGKASELIPSDLIVWAAGIRGPDLLARLDGLECNRLNQLIIRPTLQTTRDDDIFAIGDCTSLVTSTEGHSVPPTAQAAHQEAILLARSLARRLQGGTPLPFSFHERGSLISLGPKEAVGDVVEKSRGRVLEVQGVLARFSYWLLYRRRLATLVGLKKTLLAIVGSWFTDRAAPRVKLH
ncbi:MAG TPA: NAD(P)/FAD-dependent oxidoreductase [Aromatoleum sp.]|uniref:NAD(P)/FAD-dependent oxidoreductase n=1 Tax=Aromatoleum sp. TaxID=2307007 RepID=UPI002B46857C|nr:NAD(P)/FAD-dependent oxidoreductase [Aromatoleum sp.]HJV25764.1 NAD(P)/FAD-dependent oxidoreductase [Aromatoleum sp.]